MSRTAAVLLLALAVVSHLPVLTAGYVQDDHIAIEANPVVARGNLKEIFTSSYWKGSEGDDRALYRPFTIASYALDRRLGGVAAAPFSHAVNVALHAAAALVLLLLARRLGASDAAAWAAAALFAVHPAKAEAVMNVVGRAEVLAGLFTLAGLWLYTHTGLLGAARHPRLAAWATGAAAFAAMGSKETGVALPVLLVAAEWSFGPRHRSADRQTALDRLGALVPAGIAVLAWAALRTNALEAAFPLQTIPVADNPLVAQDGAVRAASAFAILARWMRLLLFPATLCIDYSGPSLPAETTFAAPLPLAGLAALGAWVAAAAAPLLPLGARPERARLLSFAALLFLVPYLISGNLLVLVGAGLAERFLYLPAAGFSLAAACGLEALRSARPRLGRACLAGALVLLAARNVARAFDWKDDETIFRAAIAANPLSPRARFAVGKVLVPDSNRVVDRAASAEALTLFEEAARLLPGHAPAWHEAGLVLARDGRYAEAEARLRRAVSLSPSWGLAWFNLALVRRRLGDLPDAERALRKAVLHDPEFAKAWAELGHVRFDRGRAAESAAAYRRAVALGRDDLRGRLAESERLAGSSR